jgi:hypothetical protein
MPWAVHAIKLCHFCGGWGLQVVGLRAFRIPLRTDFQNQTNPTSPPVWDGIRWAAVQLLCVLQACRQLWYYIMPMFVYCWWTVGVLKLKVLCRPACLPSSTTTRPCQLRSWLSALTMAL